MAWWVDRTGIGMWLTVVVTVGLSGCVSCEAGVEVERSSGRPPDATFDPISTSTSTTTVPATTTTVPSGDPLAAEDLQTGHCFNLAPSEPGADPTRVEVVYRVPCTAAHQWEVYEAYEYADIADSPLGTFCPASGCPPSTERLPAGEHMRVTCAASFTQFTGVAPESSGLTMTVLSRTTSVVPPVTKDVKCLVGDPPALTTGTLRNAAR